MKDFLRILLIEPFRDGYKSGIGIIGYILGTLMWILSIMLVGGFIWLCGWLIDSSFLQIKEKDGIIVNHCYIPAHKRYVHTKGGIIINHIPDRYFITVEIDGLTDDVQLTRNTYSTISIGEKYCFKYNNGRFFKTLYIKTFCNYEKISRL